jgi:hypothetical protein
VISGFPDETPARRWIMAKYISHYYRIASLHGVLNIMEFMLIALMCPSINARP